jgi:hypothetical protein
MAVVAEESWVVMVPFDVVGREVQPIPRVLPIWNQSRHVVVHRHIRIAVDLPAHETEVPSTRVVGITEVLKIEGFR